MRQLTDSRQAVAHVWRVCVPTGKEQEVEAVVKQTSLVWGPDAQVNALATLETIQSARYGL